MWIASKYGFYSIVRSFDKEEFLIRARQRKDLENLCKKLDPQPDIIEMPEADYRYRIFIKAEYLSNLMMLLAETIDYPNFKNMIAMQDGQDKKLNAYHRVWGIMRELQD